MKIVSVILASTASLALAACGGATTNNSVTANTLTTDPLANYGSDLGNEGSDPSAGTSNALSDGNAPGNGNALGDGNALGGSNASAGNVSVTNSSTARQ